MTLAALAVFVLFIPLVMARYPALTPGIASLAGVFTALKWLFVYGSFVVLLVGVAAWLWRRFAGRAPAR